MNFTGTTHNLLWDRVKFLYIFYVLIHVEEYIASSFKTEEFYNIDMSTSMLGIIGSFVPTQKAVKVMYKFTPNFFTSAVKETADVMFPSGYFYHNFYIRIVFGVLSCLDLVLFKCVINNREYRRQCHWRVNQYI